MNELKVGILALVTLAAIGYMSVKITSNQSGFGNYVPYRTIVKDASGIFPKTPIKVAGINAGRIKDIELQGNTALITFEILKKVKVTLGSKLKIKTVGFLGDKYIEIYINPESIKRTAKNDFLQSVEGGGIENLTTDATEILQDVKTIIYSIKESLVPLNERPPLTVILSEMKELVSSAKEVANSLKNIISGNEEKLNDTIAHLEKFTRELSNHMNKNVHGSLMKDMKEVMSTAGQIATNINELITDIRHGKGTIGQILVDDKIADEVKATLSGVKKIVSKVDAIRTELSMFSGVNTDYGGETEVGLKIFPGPERFYLLGVTTSDLGVAKKKETTTIVNGVETIAEEEVVEKDTYRFNIQIGRKIHNWFFRGGLLQSTGGLGIDYEINNWGTTFTTELFDYRKDIGINLRLVTEIHLWNVMYGKLAGEDLLLNSRSLTISAGLRFLDEDLKSMLGFFL